MVIYIYIAKRIMNCVYAILSPKGKYFLYKLLMKRTYISQAKANLMQGAFTHGSYQDCLHCIKKYGVSFDEYMYAYEFWNLNECQRKTYISSLEMLGFYRYVVPSNLKKEFWIKSNFLNTFSKYIHRQWLLARNCSFEQFSDMVNKYPCIVKPQKSCCGIGIFKICHTDIEDMKALYKKCVDSDCLIEECIEGCDEMQAFHPASLNTIRICTIHGSRGTEVFHSFMRTGRDGSIVDNAHSCSGAYATIDIHSGIVISDSYSPDGLCFAVHPNTGKQFKGFQVPKFEEMKAMCIEAADVVNIPIVGWDVVLRKDGLLEFVEGNHGPDIDLLQQPTKHGLRKEIHESLERLTDYKLFE